MPASPAETIVADCRSKMDKSVQHFEKELRGIRTGRATTALIDYLKVDYYGSPTELRELAAISVPEPTQLLVKPFDPGAKSAIIKAIESADLGLNPQAEGNQIRIAVPAPSQERRQQLVHQLRKLAEDARIAIRNERRDAMKHIDKLVKDKENSFSEDDGKAFKEEIEDLTKQHTEKIDQLADNKAKEVEDV